MLEMQETQKMQERFNKDLEEIKKSHKKSWTRLRDWTTITVVQEAVYIKDFMYYCFMNLNEDSKLHLFSNPSRNTWYFIYTKSSNAQEHLEEYLEDEYIKKQRPYFANKSPSSQGYGFPVVISIYVRGGLWRKLSTEELMLLNCGVREDSWESLGLQGDPTSPS